MANHKRGKPKNARAGCLMCKYWKINGHGKRKRLDGESFGNAKRRQFADKEKKEYTAG